MKNVFDPRWCAEGSLGVLGVLSERLQGISFVLGSVLVQFEGPFGDGLVCRDAFLFMSWSADGLWGCFL